MVILSMIGTGLALAVIHKIFGWVRHPVLVADNHKSVSDFIIDSFAMLTQHEPPPNFRSTKYSFSSGQNLSPWSIAQWI